MCDFCKKRRPKYAELVGKGQHTVRMMLDGQPRRGQTDCVFLDKSGVMGFDNSSGEYAPQFVEIAFCPFCGEPVERSGE